MKLCRYNSSDLNYPAAIEYLLSFTDFETRGHFTDRPDLGPVKSLLRRLSDPHVGPLTVHVAGSKGKGSVAAMIEAILRAYGETTGLFTSPHLHDYTERIRINGQPVSRDDFARLLTDIQPAVEAERETLGGRKLITFDLLTALGFVAFREAGVTAQVIEVGLGGRLDSTNVFTEKAAVVITPLSFEHTAILGETIGQIAAEKAAIITPRAKAILAPQEYPAAADVVRDFASRAGATLIDVAAAYRWEVLAKDLRRQTVRLEGPHGAIEAKLPLLGRHQAENAATAVAAVQSLPLDITSDAIVRGLESVRWPGRLELLREQPLVVADGAHNRDSARRLVEALKEYFNVERALFVIGASSDKDINGLAEEIAPVALRVIVARAEHPRAMDPKLIVAAFERLGVPAEDVESMPIAIQTALEATDKGGVICVSGSLFVAAEGREYFGRVD